MPPLAELRRRFRYDPATGTLRYAVNGRGFTVGSIVGHTKQTGYLYFKMDGREHAVHRVIWYMVYGTIPKIIDHVNGIGTDNRLCNLREADAAQNTWNSRVMSRNKSGVKNVCWHAKQQKWLVSFEVHKRTHYIGYFESLEDAKEARNQAAARLHGEFARIA